MKSSSPRLCRLSTNNQSLKSVSNLCMVRKHDKIQHVGVFMLNFTDKRLQPYKLFTIVIERRGREAEAHSPQLCPTSGCIPNLNQIRLHVIERGPKHPAIPPLFQQLLSGISLLDPLSGQEAPSRERQQQLCFLWLFPALGS